MAPLFSSFFCPQCEKPKKQSAASQVKVTPAEFGLGVISRIPAIQNYRLEAHLDGKLITVYFTKKITPPLGWSYTYEIPAVVRGEPSFEDIEYWAELLK